MPGQEGCFSPFVGNSLRQSGQDEGGNPGPPGPSFQFPYAMCTHTQAEMPQSPSAEPASPGQDPWSPFHLGQHRPLGGAPIGLGQQHPKAIRAQESGTVLTSIRAKFFVLAVSGPASSRLWTLLLSFFPLPPIPIPTPAPAPSAAQPELSAGSLPIRPCPPRPRLPVTEWGQLLRQTAPCREMGTLLRGGDTNATRCVWERQSSPPASCQRISRSAL